MAHLLDLNDDCLLEVLDLLSTDQLVIVLGVNRRLRRLATDKLHSMIKVISLCDKRKKVFAGCTHLSSFNFDQVLVLESINLKQVFPLRSNWWSKFLKPFVIPHQPTRADLFLSLTAKCFNVKSIELGEFQLSDKLLLQVVRSLTELECIKLIDSNFDGNDWNVILEAVGNQIVHFTKKSLRVLDYVQPSLAAIDNRFLEIVAEKCPNIRRVDWLMCRELTSTFMASIKMLPIRCWLAVYCTIFDNDGDIFEDVFDVLIVDKFNWSQFGRVDRLSSLEFKELVVFRYYQGFEFASLKKLKVKQIDSIAGFILASQFPRLESFGFNARNISKANSEYNYEAVFEHLSTVKKLIINIDFHNHFNYIPFLPSFSSIRHLDNLDTIVLIISFVPVDWQPRQEFLQQIVDYVEEISTLEKLIVDPRNYIDNPGVKKLLSVVKELKLEQNRVEVEVMN